MGKRKELRKWKRKARTEAMMGQFWFDFVMKMTPASETFARERQTGRHFAVRSAVAAIEGRREAVGMAVGAATMCWDPIPAGVFDSTEAARIVDEIMAGLVDSVSRLDIP
jgi:hypothetical protein